MQLSNRYPLPERTFRLYPTLLWWLGSGFLLVLIIVWLLTDQVTRELGEQYTEAEGRAIASLLATDFGRHLEAYPPEQWTSPEVYQRLYQVYISKAQPLGVEWVQLYRLNGTIIFSPIPEWVGLNRQDIEPQNELDFTTLTEPKVEYISWKTMGPDNNVVVRDAFEVYVPFLGDEMDMDGMSGDSWVFEIYLDASAYRRQVRLLQWEIAGLFITMGILLGGLTWHMTRRADRVIQSQIEALRQAYQHLEHLEHFRSQMTSMLAHDLKNQLAVVAGVLENLELTCSPQETDTRELVQGAQHALQQVRIMLQNLVDMARLEEARLEVRLEALDPRDLFQEAVESLAVLLQSNGNQYEIQIEPNTPHLLGDRYLLLRVLQNLIHNAVRHGGPGVHIRLLARADGQAMVLLQVQDNGPGIPPEHLPHIFERFYQVSPTKGGSGLGLAFSRLALEAMGGTISVESQPGQGATFSLRLPRAP